MFDEPGIVDAFLKAEDSTEQDICCGQRTGQCTGSQRRSQMEQDKEDGGVATVESPSQRRSRNRGCRNINVG